MGSNGACEHREPGPIVGVQRPRRLKHLNRLARPVERSKVSSKLDECPHPIIDPHAGGRLTARPTRSGTRSEPAVATAIRRRSSSRLCFGWRLFRAVVCDESGCLMTCGSPESPAPMATLRDRSRHPQYTACQRVPSPDDHRHRTPPSPCWAHRSPITHRLAPRACHRCPRLHRVREVAVGAARHS
jgi:hypothetical protein